MKKQTKTTLYELLTSVDQLNQLKKGTPQYESQHTLIRQQLKSYNSDHDPKYHESIGGIRTILQMRYVEEKHKKQGKK